MFKMHYASYRGRDCILINNWKRLITFPSTFAVGRTEENKARTQQRESVWVHSLLVYHTVEKMSGRGEGWEG